METGCLQVRVKAAQVLMTLVGAGAAGSRELVKRIVGETACVVEGECCINAVVDECNWRQLLDLLHLALFQAADPRVFSHRTPATPEFASRPKAAQHSEPHFLFPERQQALG